MCERHILQTPPSLLAPGIVNHSKGMIDSHYAATFLGKMEGQPAGSAAHVNDPASSGHAYDRFVAHLPREGLNYCLIEDAIIEVPIPLDRRGGGLVVSSVGCCRRLGGLDGHMPD